MTAYGADETIERMEAALACQSIACREAHAERDTARDLAAKLEAELAALRVLLAHVEIDALAEYDDAGGGRLTPWTLEAMAALRGLQRTGTLSAEAFTLAAALEAESGDTP